MATPINLPSGIVAARASNGRGLGQRFEICGDRGDPIILTDADVAALANHLPLCYRCGSYRVECICGDAEEVAP